MRPFIVVRRSFGFTKLHSSRLDWPHLGYQRCSLNLCEQALITTPIAAATVMARAAILTMVFAMRGR